MPSSPTPSERERADAELRDKEAAEQATLPYKWTQTIGDVDISVPVAGTLRGRDIDVVLTKTRVKVAVKGQEPIIDVCHVYRKAFFCFLPLLLSFLPSSRLCSSSTFISTYFVYSFDEGKRGQKGLSICLCVWYSS